MLKLCNIDIERREKIYKELKCFADKLRKKFSIEKVYLHGSLASGEIHEGSDIDLVIVGNFKGRMFQRIGEVLKLTDLPVEPLVYTPDEFRMMKKTNSFIKRVIASGMRL